MTTGRGAAFSLRLVSAESAGVGALPVGPADAESPVRELTGADGSVWAYEYRRAGRRCLSVPGVATFVDTHVPGEVVVFREDGASAEAVADILGRGVAPVFAHRAGLEVLHASAVELPAGVVGFCGAPGSGKSTLAYAFARRGRRQWSDDVLAIDAEAAPPAAVPLPFSPRLRPPSAALLGPYAVADIRDPASEEREPTPLTAIFLLRQDDEGDGDIRAQPVTGADAFAQALSSSLFYEDAAGDRRALTIRHFLRLASETPLLVLAFPPKLHELDRLLDSVEETVEGLDA